MKKLILVLAIAFTGQVILAQGVKTSAVPAAVTSKFTTLYPASKADQWKDVKGNYETKFTDAKIKKCVEIDPSGGVIKTTTTIPASELPKSVSEYVAKNYKDEKIKEAGKTVEADGKVKYEATVKDNHLCFDASGTFIKSEKCKK